MKNFITNILVFTFLLFSNYLIAQSTVTCIQDGNWSNGSIWAGDAVPSPFDNVQIADGYIVTVDGNFECFDLTVGGGGNKTDSQLLFADNNTLTVHGTVTLGGNGKRTGTIDMSSGGTLVCSGLAVGNANSASWVPGNGTVELAATTTLPTSVFTTFNNLTISDGILTLNSDIIVLGDWTYNSTAISIGGSGNVTLGGNFTNNNTAWINTTTTFTFNGGADQVIYSATPTAEFNSTFGTLIINKSSGTTILGNDLGVVAFTHTLGTLDQNGFQFYVGGSSQPFPVELVSFSAKIRDNKVVLYWNTATEVNNYGFEVQRSIKTDKWGVVGFVEGHGNSNSPKTYSFTDSKVNSAGTYSYRLKQIDSDGSYEFSKTIEVNLSLPMIMELKQNYPNPFNPSTTISFTLPESGNVSLKIFNSLGEEVTTLVNGYTEAGIYSYNFNAENLPSGIYIYQVTTSKNSLTKKMLFLK